MASTSQRIDRKLKINPTRVKHKLTRFIKHEVTTAKADGVVLGMSGGLDSAVTALICVEALGPEAVLAIAIPEIGTTEPQDVADARKFANKLEIEFKMADITAAVKYIRKGVGDFRTDTPIPTANLKPRLRMTILYYYANALNRLVMGTSNLSELRTGYFTKHGDGASDLAPLRGLYKTQIVKLAEYLKVPRYILRKVPSAGLWRGQTDEAELGLPYEKIDRIYAGLDLGLSRDDIAKAAGVTMKDIREFRKREKRAAHKLRGPLMPGK